MAVMHFCKAYVILGERVGEGSKVMTEEAASDGKIESIPFSLSVCVGRLLPWPSMWDEWVSAASTRPMPSD